MFIVVASTVLIYLLPRYVVNNDSEEIDSHSTDKTQAAATTTANSSHTFQMSDSLKAIVGKLYDSYINSENKEKRIIFADSLAKAYELAGKLDSTAKYLEVRALENPSSENYMIAGDGYYNAFNFAVDQSKKSFLAEKTQNYYMRVLNEDPSLLDVQAKLAMTYVSGNNPMKGIMMLREVLQKDPDNMMAIYNMGMLSITSGQFQKAVDRFNKLLSIDSDSQEANFYLGYSWLQLGDQKKAAPYFEKVVQLNIEGELLDASRQYLSNFKK